MTGRRAGLLLAGSLGVAVAAGVAFGWDGLAVGLLAPLAGACGLLVHARRLADDAVRTRELLGVGANDLLWTWHPDSGRAWFGGRWVDVLGMPGGHTIGLDRWLDRIAPRDIEGVRTALEGLREGRTEVATVEHRVSEGESWRSFRLTAIAETRSRGRMLAGGLADITEQVESEARLTHGAFHDSLTGLPNRALLLDRLGHCVARARRAPEYRFAVLFLDLDGFKVINDSRGHRFGDALLLRIAQRLVRSIRPGDTVARLGGDEFVVLVDPVDGVLQAEEIAVRLHDALADPFDVYGHEVVISASVGVALSDRRYRDPDEMVRDADTAMYRAKADGKARHRVFHPDMHQTAVVRLRREQQLRAALSSGDLVVVYQPIVNLASGAIEGFEALARLRGADGVLIGPEEFISVAEETGLIEGLTHAVIRDVIAQAATWRRAGYELYVSANLSGRLLRASDLPETVAALLEEHGLPASALELELTETALVDVLDSANDLLVRLRGLGLLLCLDDFGTGYSSLSYLHRFTVDRLKIDRSFVAELHGVRSPGIVRTVIELSKSLSLSVTGEGVETETQLATLRALGCTSAQGWLFARPMPADEATALLARDRRW